MDIIIIACDDSYNLLIEVRPLMCLFHNSEGFKSVNIFITQLQQRELLLIQHVQFYWGYFVMHEVIFNVVWGLHNRDDGVQITVLPFLNRYLATVYCYSI